jgi:antitoxin component of MazEF toxin-antitoxin module
VIKLEDTYHLKVKRYVRGMDTSLYVALPKYWAEEVGLQKNDAVEVEFLSRNELIIRVPVKEQ